jgi:hypothetical protein
MGGECSTYGKSKGVYRVLLGKPEERDYVEDPGADGRIILIWILRKWDEGMDWIDVVQIGTGGGHL